MSGGKKSENLDESLNSNTNNMPGKPCIYGNVGHGINLVVSAGLGQSGLVTIPTVITLDREELSPSFMSLFGKIFEIYSQSRD